MFNLHTFIVSIHSHDNFWFINNAMLVLICDLLFILNQQETDLNLTNIPSSWEIYYRNRFREKHLERKRSCFCRIWNMFKNASEINDVREQSTCTHGRTRSILQYCTFTGVNTKELFRLLVLFRKTTQPTKQRCKQNNSAKF